MSGAATVKELCYMRDNADFNNNNNNNMYLKSSIQTSSIDYIKENIHITLNISSNIPIQ